MSRIFPVGAQLVVGGYFLYAGVSKLGLTDLFADQIHSYQLLPFWLTLHVALGLPLYEIAAALCLLHKKIRRVGLISILMMLAVFIVALMSAMIRNLDIHCGCTGQASVSLEFALVRNLLFFFVILYLLIRERSSDAG